MLELLYKVKLFFFIYETNSFRATLHCEQGGKNTILVDEIRSMNF